MTIKLFIYTPCLLLHFHHVHWDQIKESLCLYLESRPMPGKGLLALVPLLFGPVCHYQSVHPLQFPPSGNVSRQIFLTWPFLIDIGMPDDLLTLWNCFIDFAVENWCGCRANEPGYAGDIGIIEIWLIDWWIDWNDKVTISSKPRIKKLAVNLFSILTTSLW